MIPPICRNSAAITRALVIVLLAASVALAQTRTAWAESHLRLTDLKCEYATNPIGLDVASPQFSWRIESDKRMALQGAYRILVADSTEHLSNDIGNVWDSGQQQSSRSCGVAYQGKELASRKSYCWKV